MASTICSKCGSEHTQGKAFCGDCGAPACTSCSKCGSELVPGKAFCADCGAPVSVDTHPSLTAITPITTAGAVPVAPEEALAHNGALNNHIIMYNLFFYFFIFYFLHNIFWFC